MDWENAPVPPLEAAPSPAGFYGTAAGGAPREKSGAREPGGSRPAPPDCRQYQQLQYEPGRPESGSFGRAPVVSGQYAPGQPPAGRNPTRPDLFAGPVPADAGFFAGPVPARAGLFAGPVPAGDQLGMGPWPVQAAPATPTRAFAAPLSAPVMSDAPALAPDELFREWQGSVRQAARRTPWTSRRPAAPVTRRGRARRVAAIGVPAAVIVTVGAGALLMLTGRANEMLARTGALSPATPGISARLGPVSTALAGYPGQDGSTGVAALWSADGLTVAVGYADGHPAVWRRAADGSWSLTSAAVLGGLPGHLTAVTQGPLGWVAVGSVHENGTVEPMLYQSADGTTWTPLPALTALAGDSAQFLAVAAGPGGYLVAGRQGSGQQASAALWWSADLRNWSNGANRGSTGSVTTAAVSVGKGFVAAGSGNDGHTIWTSPDGRQWTAHDLPKPAGAHRATLRSLAASPAGHVVAAGYAVGDAGELPIVVVSADAGAHLTQVVLRAPGGPATVTAVTADGDGFVAVGLAGSGGAQRAVRWTSPDGLSWSAAVPLGAAGRSEVTALADTGVPGGDAVVTGTVQHGLTADLLTVPAR